VLNFLCAHLLSLAVECFQKTRRQHSCLSAGTRLITLENGLTVMCAKTTARRRFGASLVHERQHSRRPLAWRGLSHVLEHMLFKGTVTRPGARIDQEVQEAGGYMNAYTSFDRTVYWINVPNTGARVAIDISATSCKMRRCRGGTREGTRCHPSRNGHGTG